MTNVLDHSPGHDQTQSFVAAANRAPPKNHRKTSVDPTSRGDPDLTISPYHRAAGGRLSPRAFRYCYAVDDRRMRIACLNYLRNWPRGNAIGSTGLGAVQEHLGARLHTVRRGPPLASFPRCRVGAGAQCVTYGQ